MSKDQRDEQVIIDWYHDIKIVKARTKYDRRRKMLVVQDGDQILGEYFLDQLAVATQFMLGYAMGKSVWRGTSKDEL